MADEKTVIVCNRGANTLSAFSTDGKLRYLGEWATGNCLGTFWQIPGTDLIVNACNKEGTLVIFAWNGKELIRKDEIILPGAHPARFIYPESKRTHSLCFRSAAKMPAESAGLRRASQQKNEFFVQGGFQAGSRLVLL